MQKVKDVTIEKELVEGMRDTDPILYSEGTGRGSTWVSVDMSRRVTTIVDEKMNRHKGRAYLGTSRPDPERIKDDKQVVNCITDPV